MGFVSSACFLLSVFSTAAGFAGSGGESGRVGGGGGEGAGAWLDATVSLSSPSSLMGLSSESVKEWSFKVWT